MKSAITDGKKKIAIAHATGTGKSYLIAKLFEDYSSDKKLVLVPSTYISDQLEMMNMLIPKARMKPINIIDIRNGNVYRYSSISEAGKALKREFYIVKNDSTGSSAIYDHLTGHTKNPIYKERFRFEYAD